MPPSDGHFNMKTVLGDQTADLLIGGSTRIIKMTYSSLAASPNQKHSDHLCVKGVAVKTNPWPGLQLKQKLAVSQTSLQVCMVTAHRAKALTRDWDEALINEHWQQSEPTSSSTRSLNPNRADYLLSFSAVRVTGDAAWLERGFGHQSNQPQSGRRRRLKGHPG